MRAKIIDASYHEVKGHYSDADAKALAYQAQVRQNEAERGFVDGPWKDTIVGRMRYFEDGSVNFYAYPLSVRTRLGELRARWEAKRTKRGESENVEQSRESSAKRAKKNVRLRCQTIAGDRLLTLTYRGAMTDVDRLKRDFDAFRRAMRRAGEWHYVAVPEQHKSGGWHIHIVVHGRLAYNLVRGIWRRVVGTDEQGRTGGNINVRNPKDGVKYGKWKRHALAAYIAKYIAKDVGDHDLNKKRYWSSKGIPVPEPVTYFSQDGGDMHSVIVDAMHAAMEVCPADQIQAYVSGGGRYFFVGASPAL